MKRSYLIAGALAMMLGGPLLGQAVPAYAGNAAVSSTLSNYSDVSMFYQAMVSTGVINELNENTHYTIFAPTNAAFSVITPQNYPCFYSDQCRAQVAALIRNHIVADNYTLPELSEYGQGLQTLGTKRVLVTEQYKGSYTVNGQNILSDGNTGANNVYRINGVLSDPQELAQYRTMNVVPASAPADTMTVQKTVTQRTYHVPPPVVDSYHSTAVNPYPVDPDDTNVETTTVIRSYSTEPY